jgi:hypothetical protein
MANISTVFGSVSLRGKWTDDMLKNLNVLRKDWATYYYNTEIDDDFSEDSLEQSFIASGRRTYINNLTNLADWSADNAADAVRDLAKAMSEQTDSGIIFNYTEDEPGSCFLQTASVEIVPDKFNPKTYLASMPNKTYLRFGMFNIMLSERPENLDDLLSLTPDGLKYKLNLPEYKLEFMKLYDTESEDLPIITKQNGENVIKSFFIEIVLEDNQPDNFSKLIAEKPKNSFTQPFIGEIKAIYIPTHTLNANELESINYDYTSGNLIDLGIYDDDNNIFENYAGFIDIDAKPEKNKDTAENLKEFFGEYYDEFLDYLIENDDTLTHDKLTTAGF